MTARKKPRSEAMGRERAGEDLYKDNKTSNKPRDFLSFVSLLLILILTNSSDIAFDVKG